MEYKGKGEHSVNNLEKIIEDLQATIEKLNEKINNLEVELMSEIADFDRR